MHVVRLALQHFRLYDRKVFDLSSGINVLCGPNAQGKTTVLEAVFACALGKSFRTSQFNDLIQKDQIGFCIDCSYQKCGIQQEVRLCGSKDDKYALFCGSRQPFSALLGGLLVVSSLPEDIQLIKGSPSFRREYLDQQMLQVDPLYGHHLKRYARALKQRNSLLRQKALQTLDSWEYELAHSAAYLIEKRKSALEKLSPLCAELYACLSGQPAGLVLRYKPGVACSGPLRETLRSVWRAQRERDMHAESTLSGPHKDDYAIILRGMDLRHFGSEGEQRTAALTLRLAEWEWMNAQSDEDKPVLLIDDIGYGLDSNRQNNLVDWLKQAGQVLITTTQIESRWSDSKIFDLSGPTG